MKITDFSATPASTLIDKRVADRLVGTDSRYGPRRCVVWHGLHWCGPTLRATMTMSPCGPVQVDAIATDLRNITPKQNAVIGRDLLAHVESLDSVTGRLTCRVPQRGRRGAKR